MSIRLPALDQKALNESPISDESSTESGHTLGNEKPHSLLNTNFVGSLPGNLEGFRKPENSPEKRTEFLPSILGNTSQLARVKAHNIANISDNNINFQSSSSRPLTGNQSAAWRAALPVQATKVQQKEQRRSLRANPGPATFSIVLEEKPHNTNGRRGSGLPPIQFINNFPNYVPVQNNLNRLENFSPHLNDVMNEKLFDTPNSARKDLIKSNSGEDPIEINSATLQAQRLKNDKSTLSSGPTPRASIPFSPRSLNKIIEFPQNPENKTDSPKKVPEPNKEQNSILPLFGATLANVLPANKRSPINRAMLEPSVVNSSSEFEKEALKESSKKLFFPKFTQMRAFGVDKQNIQQVPQSPTNRPDKAPQGRLSLFGRFARTNTESNSNSASPEKFSSGQLNVRPFRAGKGKSEGIFQGEPEHNTSKNKRFSLNAKNSEDAAAMIVSKLKTGRKSCLQVREPGDGPAVRPRIKTKQGKKVKIIAVTKEQKRLRQVLWALIYPQLLIGETSKPVEIHRHISIENFEVKFPQYVNLTVEFIKSHCSDALYQLYNNAKSMIVVANEEKTLFGWKKMTAEVIEKRTITMMAKLKILFESVIKAITENKLPPAVIDFLAAISKEHSIMPQNYLFLFELSRLKFDRHGSLKNVSHFRSKMILGMFFFMRILLYRFIIHPWDTMMKVPHKDRTTRNLKSCSSVLYHIVVDLFSENLKIVPKNQIFINLKNRIHPTKEKLTAFPNSNPEEEIRADSIITGLYTREQLRPFFSTQSHQVQELTGMVEKLLSSLFSAVHN